MEKISFVSLTFLLISIRITPMFFAFPEFDAPAGKANWIALLLSTLPVMLGLWVALRLWRLEPDRSFAHTINARMGRIAGGAINLAYAAFFLLQAALTLWELDEILLTTMFFRTPSTAVSGAMMLVVILAVRQGIETIARTSIVLVAGGIVATALSTLVLLPEISIDHLRPMFPVDLADLIRSAIYHTSLAIFVVVTPFLLPYTAVRSGNLRNLLAAPVLANGLIALAMLLAIGVLSFPVLDNDNFEYLALVRQASLGTFLERLDPLVLTGWVVLGYLRISAFFLSALTAMSAVFGLRDYRPLSVPMGIIVLCLALIAFKTYTAREVYHTSGGIPLNLFFMFILPLALWLILRPQTSPATSPRASHPSRSE